MDLAVSLHLIGVLFIKQNLEEKKNIVGLMNLK